MRSSELRELPPEELTAHIRTARREIFGLRFQHATGELENTSRLSGARRDIAKLLTVAKERGIDVEKELKR